MLEDGKVKAEGNHLEILESDNIYSEYWKELSTD